MRAKTAINFLAVIFFCFFLFLSDYSNADQTDPTPYSVQSDTTAKVSVDVASNIGAANSSIPIEVPPGRNGIAPKLALIYNSNMGNGIVGVGWNLGLGEIQRSTKRGLNYGACDFVFVINGASTELAPRSGCGAGYYDEKIERTFSQYYFDGTSWVVTTKDGTKYYYGASPNSRQQPNQAGVFKWALEKVQDTNGNYMTVYYKNNYYGDGEIYIDRIDYTGNANSPVLNPTNYVQFYYEARTDAPPMYTTNAAVRTSQRLKTIEAYANGTPARKYVLDYCADNIPGCYSSSTGRSFVLTTSL